MTCQIASEAAFGVPHCVFHNRFAVGCLMRSGHCLDSPHASGALRHTFLNADANVCLLGSWLCQMTVYNTVQDSPATGASKGSANNAADKYSSILATSNNNEDGDFDDFDPQGTSNSSKPFTYNSAFSEDTNRSALTKVDLFAPSLAAASSPPIVAPEMEPAESNIYLVDPFVRI
ncbi:hypothetical protein Tco_0046822 [Tanacetum coccineum]